MPEIRKVVFYALLAAFGFGFGLAACENTIRGAGRDIQETGEAVEDTVEGNP
jgi:predicted small secreted protein